MKKSFSETNSKSPFIEVLTFSSVDLLLTYSVPEEWQGQIKPGKRVLIPLKKRQAIGFIIRELHQLQERKDLEIKPILTILDEQPLFDEGYLNLCRTVADYYMCTLAQVLKTALPSNVLPKIHKIYSLTEPGNELAARADFSEAIKNWSALKSKLFSFIVVNSSISWVNLIKKMSLKRDSDRIRAATELRSLGEDGFIKEDFELQEDLYKPRQEIFLTLNSDELAKLDLTKLEKRAPGQKKILDFLAVYPAGVWRKQLSQNLKKPGQSLKALLRKSLLIEETRAFEESTSYQWEPSLEELEIISRKVLKLNFFQEKALQLINQQLSKDQYKCFLLHGVTGSGKTEIYMQAAQRVLESGRQVLLLIPEIALAPLTIQRFRNRFGDCIEVLHSQLSARRRLQAWRQIRKGSVSIVIGARSAVFAPLRKLGLIIVDEEHEPAYKQESTPTYHAREVALLRAFNENIPVILGSATPSLESYHNACTGKYFYVSIPKRIGDQTLPQISMIDMRKHNPAMLADRIISAPLRRGLTACLKSGQQALIFLNRRGFACFLQCGKCGYVVSCKRCSVTLTLHRFTSKAKREKIDSNSEGVLHCHQCEARQKLPDKCPACGGEAWNFRGAGTERLEEELQKLFPQARIIRLDRDTAKGKEFYEKFMQEVGERQVEIIVGTQMIAKGHHFPGITLVGVINADVALQIPDFRNSERTFQLICQVAGRAGRGALQGYALVQSYNPEHYCLKTALKHDYYAFVRQELHFRQQLGLPPYSRFIQILVYGENQTRVEKYCQKIYLNLRQSKSGNKVVQKYGLKILGPGPAPLMLLKNQYRYQIILQTKSIKPVLRFLKASLSSGAQKILPTPSGVKLRIDVDPVNML